MTLIFQRYVTRYVIIDGEKKPKSKNQAQLRQRLTFVREKYHLGHDYPP